MSNLCLKAQLGAMKALTELRRIEQGEEPTRTISEKGQLNHVEWKRAERDAAKEEANRISESLREWDGDALTGAL